MVQPPGPRPPQEPGPLHVELLGPDAASFVRDYELRHFEPASGPNDDPGQAGNGARQAAPAFRGDLPPREALQALQIVVEEHAAATLRASARPVWLFTPRWDGAETPPTFALKGTYSVLLASLPPVDSHGRTVIVFPHQRQQLADILADVQATARSGPAGLATWPGEAMEGPTDGRDLYYWRLGEGEERA